MIEFTSIMSARIEEIERSFGDLYKYFSRGAAAYSGFLFPEDDPYPVINGGGITHILAKMIAGYYKWLAAKDTTDENTVSLAKKYFHLSLDDGEVIITPCSANEVQEKFGGREYFFRRGAKILDTGCGVGKAVAELTEIYKERGVKIIGLDLRPHAFIYPSIGYYVGGNWARLPFKDHAFDGILGCESFPTHISYYDDYKAIIQEITRVSRPGTIWRATGVGEIRPEEDRNEMILTRMLVEGWDVCLRQGSFIARLQSK